MGQLFGGKISVRDVVGSRHFSLAWGYTTIMSGVMSTVGPPAAGTYIVREQ